MLDCFPAKTSKDQCKCENLVTFQNYATNEVRRLTQRYILSECFLGTDQEQLKEIIAIKSKLPPWLKSIYCNEKLNYLEIVNLQEAGLFRLEVSFTEGTKHISKDRNF